MQDGPTAPEQALSNRFCKNATNRLQSSTDYPAPPPPADVDLVEPVLYRICQEYQAYEQSGSREWDRTIDVAARPAWMRQILGDDAAPAPRGAGAGAETAVMIKEAVAVSDRTLIVRLAEGRTVNELRDVAWSWNSTQDH